MYRTLLAVTLTLFCTSQALAETVKLTSGKVIKGTIQSMDSQQVKIQTDDQKTQTIQRGEIAQITFVEEAAPSKRSFSISEMLKELRVEGIDEEAWADLKKRIRIMETPELKRYFNDTIAGLQDDLKNLRNDAQDVQNEIVELRKEYGPQADTLNDYMIALEDILGTGDADYETTIKVGVHPDDEQVFNDSKSDEQNRNARTSQSDKTVK